MHAAQPANFGSRVKAPGLGFLARQPHPTRRDWARHAYWQRIHKYLYRSLSGICSYCASYTPRRAAGGQPDHTSVDHFVPKAVGNHEQAYDWSNLRLCRARLNRRKNSYRDVLDPCTIGQRWFQLDFISFYLHPDLSLALSDQQSINATINRLELNSDDQYVDERARVTYLFADGKITLAQVDSMYPFIASEMKAQDFANAYLPQFKKALTSPQLRSALLKRGWA